VISNTRRSTKARRRRSYLVLFLLLGALMSTRYASDAEDASANSAWSDDAHPPIDIATLDNIPVETWGVSGQNPGQTQTPSLDVLVWDIQQVGDRIFVGGGFLNVQEDENATPIPQPYLAAFDLDTGEWESTCTPDFDRIIYALTVNARGKLLVGGEFTEVNGQPREGLVALDPDTCQVDPLFEGAVERPWSSKRAMVRELEVVNGELYVVGNFSHVIGPNGQRERVYKSARMNDKWGTLDPNWKPNVSGSSIWGIAVDDVRGRVHFAGYFTSVNGQPNSGYFHTVDTATGASVGGLQPLPRNYPNGQPEMFDVAMGIDTVFVAGEQHIVQVLDASDHTMLGFHHTGNTGCPGYGYDHFMYCSGFSGGAYQVAERIGDIVFSGCHCTRDERYGILSHYESYSDTRQALKVIMAYDASTGELIETFDPDATVTKDGAWTVASDTNGCLYVGGDYENIGVEAQLGSWAGGFIKMCPSGWEPPGPDVDPPTVPANVVGTDLGGGNVQLTWDPSTDPSGVQSYLIYRNGAYIGWTPGGVEQYTDVGLTEGLTYQYELRAVDPIPNQSEKSAPVVVTPGGPDLEPPTVPGGVVATDLGGGSVQIDWTASTDNVGIQSYLIYRDGGYVGWTPDGTVTITENGLTEGLTYSYEVRAVDLASNQSAKSAPVTVTPGGPDLEPPTVPTDLTGIDLGGGSVQLDWTASTDNVGLSSYLIFRNGLYVGWIAAGTETYTDIGLTPGLTYTYEVRAVDLAGNRSDKSAPVVITVGP